MENKCRHWPGSAGRVDNSATLVTTEPTSTPASSATTINLKDLLDEDNDLDGWDKDPLELTEDDCAKTLSAVES